MMTGGGHKNTLWKALGLYGAGSWVVLQVVDVLAQNAGLPAWVFSFALVLLVIGLPIVGVTAYLQGFGGASEAASGVAGTSEDAGAAGATGVSAGSRGLFTWRNAITGGLGAMALWGLLVTGWMFLGPGASRGADGTGGEAFGATASNLRSVAVLPFATRSEDKQDAYFSEGMHDDVLTQLSKIDSLTVISRTSVMQYAGTTKPIPEIARELGVATILEGGIQRAGDRVRINVQLIEASTDRHLWAETYDEELTAANVFAIQSDLAKKIAGALKTTLSPAVAARIDARPTENTEALELYSRARYLILSAAGSAPDIQARDLLEQAVELAGIVLSFVAATVLAGTLAEFLETRLDASYSLALVLSFVALVLVGILLSRLVAVAIGKVVKMTILRVIDRLTGAMLGLLLGMLIASLLITLTLEVPLPQDLRKDVAKSSMVLFLRPIAGQVYDWVAAHGSKSKRFEDFFKNSQSV